MTINVRTVAISSAEGSMMETDRKEAEKKGYPCAEDLERYIKENWIPEEPEKASDEDRVFGITIKERRNSSEKNNNSCDSSNNHGNSVV